MGELHVVVGGQFGSEAKGHVTHRLTRIKRAQNRDVVVARIGGPNAGHSAVDIDGKKWALRQVPVGALVPGVNLVISAGSEVDLDVLEDEVEALDKAGFRVSERLFIDAAATLLETRHHAAERHSGIVQRIGSTGKGIGAARSDRIMRRARTVRDAVTEVTQYGTVTDTAGFLAGTARLGGTVIIEGTQGYGLGLHTKFYPQVTSNNCRAIDFLAMAGLSPWELRLDNDRPTVWVTIRPYPIRVAGNSGPLKNETTWEALGLPPEHTTVTKKVRRVGEWDPELVRHAVKANGRTAVRVALTMVDQVFPELIDMDGPWDHVTGLLGPDIRTKLEECVKRVEHDCGARVALLGTGPNSMILKEEL